MSGVRSLGLQIVSSGRMLEGSGISLPRSNPRATTYQLMSGEEPQVLHL